MSDPDRDVTLPWQYTVLAFVWVVGVLAIGILLVVSIRGMVPADVRAKVRPYPIGYLIFAGILTPFLILGGRKTVCAWRQQDPAAPQSGLGRVTPLSPEKGAGLNVLMMLVAIVPALMTISGRLDPVTGVSICGGLLAAGIMGLVRHSGRR